MNIKVKVLDRAIVQYIRRYRYVDHFPEAAFSDLALRVFSYQYENNRFYRLFCELEGKNPGNTVHWKEIPAVPAQAFKELALAAFPVKRALRIFRTSGTTQGERGVHYFDTLKLYREAIAPSFARYLLPDRKRIDMFFLTASPAELKDSSLSYMMGIVQKRFGYSRPGCFYVKKGKVLSGQLASDLVRAKTPVMILATAFSLKAFLDYLKVSDRRIVLKKGSRLMETGGFKGSARQVSKAVLYRECDKFMGIPPHHCVSEYGMTELTSQFYDTTLDDYFKGKRRRPVKRGPAWLATLVVDPVTGKEVRLNGRGILRHFDLANRGSVMALQTEDEGIRHADGFELLGRARGASLRGCSMTYEKFLKGTQ